ncbi:dihydrolipoyl dehydrogenase [candidate division KSB1 bacterium]|nr:MAG: dihydrolipoyl dehydrogenase [candidate division KSB1 bacterium]
MTALAADFDVVVLGGGPGGYVAAIRAAQLGLKVCVIDEQPLGGVCVNWGCIPSKALLKSAEFYQEIKHAAPDLGIQAEIKGYDWKRIIQRSRDVSHKNSSGVEYLAKKLGIQRIDGRFRMAAEREVEVLDKETRQNVIARVRGSHIIIATGSRNRNIPGITVDGKRIITYKEAMILDPQPQSMVIIGAGAIGIEFAYFYAAMGTKVTVIEMLPRILPIEDAESSTFLGRYLKKLGIDVHVSSPVESVNAVGEQVIVKANTPGGAKEFTADACLVAVGFTANLEDWGFEQTGVAVDRGFIKTDEFYRTNVPGYYAIGDVIGPPQLAHVASHEGIICVEKIAGKDPKSLDYSNIPSCVYCQPQVASVGLTEQACQEKNIAVKIGKFPFTASGKANAVGHTDGFVKLIFDAASDRLLGAHIVGSEATEMIAELCIARALNATASDLFETIHAHPTLSEAVMEAAAAAHGHAIHYLGRA